MSKVKLLLFLLTFSCSLGLQDSDKYAKYIDKEVKVFLEDSEYSDYEEYIFLNDPVTVFRGVLLKYDSININLYINDPQYVEYVSKTLEWDFEKVKKEKISRITVIGGYGLIYDSANN